MIPLRQRMMPTSAEIVNLANSLVFVILTPLPAAYVCKIDIPGRFGQTDSMKQQQLYRKIGDALQMRRLELGRTQGDVANAAGLSRPSLANIEAGRQAITVHQLFVFADVLDLKDPALLLPRRTRAIDDAPTSTDLSFTGDTLSDEEKASISQIVKSGRSRS